MIYFCYASDANFARFLAHPGSTVTGEVPFNTEGQTHSGPRTSPKWNPSQKEGAISIPAS